MYARNKHYSTNQNNKIKLKKLPFFTMLHIVNMSLFLSKTFGVFFFLIAHNKFKINHFAISTC